MPDLSLPPTNGADGALPIIDLPASGPQDERPGISDASPGELLSWFADRGEAAFRARQLADHVWSGRAQSYSAPVPETADAVVVILQSEVGGPVLGARRIDVR